MPTTPTLHVHPVSDANRLGLNFRSEAHALPWRRPIVDVHTHIQDVDAARVFFDVCDCFGVERIWSMTEFDNTQAITDVFGDRIAFIAVPDYSKRFDPDTFGRDWLGRIEQFANAGSKMCKFWAAPRGRDLSPHLRLDAPIRREGMRLARDAGMQFMTHVADPDTWFATHYKDARKYDRKIDHYEPLKRALEEFSDVKWIAAHMGGHPEDLDHLQELLDTYPHLHLDTSATKWMVRELSKHADAFRAFCRHNPGRVLFGSDIVANRENMDFDLYASRYWALRILMETDYDGPSPIVDPDLPLVDPTLDAKATAQLRGAAIDPTTLSAVYRGAYERFTNHRA